MLVTGLGRRRWWRRARRLIVTFRDGVFSADSMTVTRIDIASASLGGCADDGVCDLGHCNDTGTTCQCFQTSSATLPGQSAPYSTDGVELTLGDGTATYCITDEGLGAP